MVDATEPTFPLRSETVPSTTPVKGTFASRYWIPVALLVAAGWGALFSFAVIYLSDDTPFRPVASTVGKGDFPGSLPPDPAEIMRVVAAELPKPAPAPSTPLEGTLAGAPGAQPATQPSVPPVPAEQVAPAPVPVVEHAQPDPGDPAEQAKPEFVGVWGPTKQACGARAKRLGLLQATISPERAKAGKTTCNFRNVRRSGNAWVMGADCSDGAQRWASQVRLLVDEDRLTWTSGKGLANYVRCGRRAG